MFSQAGVIRVDTLHQLFDVGQLLVTQPLPTGDRVAILGNSDALGLLAADACAEAGLSVIGQPISLPPAASAEDFRLSLAGVFDDPSVDSVVTVFIPPLVTSHEEVAAVLAEAASRTEKTVVSTFLGVRGVPEQLRVPGAGPGEPAARGSVPSYPTPEDAVRALAAVTAYAGWRRRPRGRVPELDVDTAGARAVARSLLLESPLGLEPERPDVEALLQCYGIEVCPQVLASDAEGAVAAAERFGYPVVLKAAAAHLRHRPDLRDVRLDLADATAVRRAHAGITAGLGTAPREVVVQPMAVPGIACVVASTEDPLFGPVVSFGLGGLATELLGDRAYRIPPLTDADVGDLVRSVRAAPLLFGHRGADPVDTDALEDLLLRVARLADDVPEVAELELNPVLVAERGLAVLHARLRLAPTGARADTGPRRLPG